MKRAMITFKHSRLDSLSAEQWGVVLAVLAAAGFSLKAIFVKLAYAQGSLDAVGLLALRMLIAMPLFLLLGWKSLQQGPALRAKDWGLLSILGLCGYYGASILDFMGLQYISAALERLILFTYPTLTLLLNVVLVGQRIHAREGVALLLTYAGIALAFGHDLQFSTQDPHTLWLGAGLVFASALSYSIYNVGAGKMIRTLGSMRFAVLASGVSTTAAVLHFVSTREVAMLNQPWPVLGYGLAMAVFSTVLPVFWQARAIQLIGPNRSVLIGTLGPVLTIALGYWVLDEAVSLAQMAGATLVVLGVYWVGKASKTGK